MDVVAAIEGPEDAFRCTEIRQNGIGAGSSEAAVLSPCSVSTAMRTAELAWRRALAAPQTLAQVQAEAERQTPGLGDRVRSWYARN